MAAGVSLREENLSAFHEALVRSVIAQAGSDTLVPKVHIDTEIRFPQLTLDLLDSYELLRPFGQGNAQPLFMSKGVRILGEPRLLKERNLKFRFEQDGVEHEGIYFNAAGIDLPKGLCDIAFTIDRNEFRGRTRVNLTLQAVRKTS